MTLAGMTASVRWSPRGRTMGISVKAPRISATDYALTRIEQVRANRKQPDAGVRIAITGRREGQFSYDLALVNAGEEREGELSVDGPSGIRFTMPLESAPYLDGITIDADRASGALRVENPNPLWLDGLARDVQRLLDDEINPSVASHGGFIDLLDISDGVAFINMGGGCQGCGMAEVTLGQGVRVAILERFPEITEVRDTTDHAQGANPYYQAAKK
jgi:Fe/S biogenesis protein NfuA